MGYSDVICVGAGGIDITASGVDENQVFHNMVNFVDNITVCAGGDAMNEALTVAKLGHTVSFMGCIGHDLMGWVLKLNAEKYGVDMSSLRILQDSSTMTVVSLVGDNDKRNFLFKKENATERVDLDCIDWDKVEHARILSFGSLAFNKGFRPDQLKTLFSRAKEHGVITCADVALTGAEKEAIRDIAEALPYVDYLFPNAEEASQISGERENTRIADFFLHYGVKNVVMKLGGDGCYYKGVEGEMTLPAFRVKVVNTTGAGDNFLAGFLSGLLQQLPLGERLRFATATAALTVQVEGASEGVECMEQVKRFLAEHSLQQEVFR